MFCANYPQRTFGLTIHNCIDIKSNCVRLHRACRRPVNHTQNTTNNHAATAHRANYRFGPKTQSNIIKQLYTQKVKPIFQLSLCTWFVLFRRRLLFLRRQHYNSHLTDDEIRQQIMLFTTNHRSPTAAIARTCKHFYVSIDTIPQAHTLSGLINMITEYSEYRNIKVHLTRYMLLLPVYVNQGREFKNCSIAVLMIACNLIYHLWF